jgi:hypothetical protein
VTDGTCAEIPDQPLLANRALAAGGSASHILTGPVESRTGTAPASPRRAIASLAAEHRPALDDQGKGAAFLAELPVVLAKRKLEAV